jgi:AraC-like DNA-binding protein
MAESCTDRLDALLTHFPVRARLFRSGALCGINALDAPTGTGQLHVIQTQSLDIVHEGGVAPLHLTEPSLLLYPRPLARRFIATESGTTITACAHLHFEGGAMNPIAMALPDVICLPLAGVDGLDRSLAMIFEEASSDHCGRREVVDRLLEVVLIQLLRHLMESNRVQGGMLAGMSHPKLRKALIGVHEQPASEWSLDTMSEVAGMSRSAFANTFHDTVGCTPGSYLQAWRVRLTQKALLNGQPLKMIAVDVGYASEAALSRAFKAQCGLSPREWRQASTG